MRPGTLIIGIDDAPPIPMQEGSPENGDFRGYEVDLLDEIARRTSVALQYRRALWSTIVQELSSGTIDAVCSAATVTEERAQTADFCVPHLRLTLAIVARLGDRPATTIAGRRIGVRTGTTAEAFARARGVSTPSLISESNDELYAALAAGAIDAVIDDSPIADHFSRAVAGLQYAGALPDTDAAYAIMVRKGNLELRTRLNDAIVAMDTDGTLSRLRTRWHLPMQMGGS